MGLLDWLRRAKEERELLRRAGAAQARLRQCRTLEEQEEIPCPACGARLVGFVDETTGGRGGALHCSGCGRWGFHFEFAEPVKDWQLRLGRFLH